MKNTAQLHERICDLNFDHEFDDYQLTSDEEDFNDFDGPEVDESEENIEFEDDILFSDWDLKLFSFVQTHRRPAMRCEWDWMRYQFELEHRIAQTTQASTALAADGDNIRAAWRARNTIAASQGFQVNINGDQYTLTVTPRETGETYIFELSLEKNGKMFIPGPDDNIPVIETTDGQKITLPLGYKDLNCEEFFKLIVSKLSLDGGEKFVTLESIRDN